jgi:hypothetical protein
MWVGFLPNNVGIRKGLFGRSGMNIVRDEIEPSLQQGFTQGWSVAEEYEISGGLLRPKGAIKRVYSPVVYDELPMCSSNSNAGTRRVSSNLQELMAT